MDYLTPFFTLSYPTSTPVSPDSFPNSQYYNVGPKDGCLLLSALVGLAIAREVVRLGIMDPFAQWYLRTGRWKVQEKKLVANGHANGTANGKPVANGHSKATMNGNGHANGYSNGYSKTAKQHRVRERNVTRFAEQGWSFVYYVVFWTYGMYIHMSLPTHAWNPIHIWKGWPDAHSPIPTEIKIYYLTQLAFWFHQVLILNAEAHRKDHWQMMSHHFITIMLVGASYLSHFTRAGCLILVLLDFCDIVLPLAKMLRYLEFTTLCDVLFGVFLVSWLGTRQIMFFRVVVSLAFDGPKYIPINNWPAWPVINGQTYAWHLFVVLLVSLLVLMCIWFATICRVAWKVVNGSAAEDVRSDDEDDDTSETESKKKQ